MVVIDLRGTGIWPKAIPALTDEQQRVRDTFMGRWLEVLPQRYGVIERFNHGYPVVAHPRGRTLEIGAGLGEHLRYENLEQQDYYALELREELTATIRNRYPTVSAVVADCQQRLPFEDRFFDRVLAIHVLVDHPTFAGDVQRCAASDNIPP